MIEQIPNYKWNNFNFKPPLLKRIATKQYLLASQPKVLTFHIKRFYQSLYSFQKLGTAVSYPKILDLTPFLIRNENAAYNIYRYRLYGVVVHMGNMNNGHYVAYIRKIGKSEDDPQKDTWWYLSDEQYYQISEEEVFTQQAYLLFYERIEQGQE